MFTTFTEKILPIRKFVGFLCYRNYSHVCIEKHIYTSFFVKSAKKNSQSEVLELPNSPYSQGGRDWNVF